MSRKKESSKNGPFSPALAFCSSIIVPFLPAFVLCDRRKLICRVINRAEIKVRRGRNAKDDAAGIEKVAPSFNEASSQAAKYTLIASPHKDAGSVRRFFLLVSFLTK